MERVILHLLLNEYIVFGKSRNHDLCMCVNEHDNLQMVVLIEFPFGRMY